MRRPWTAWILVLLLFALARAGEETTTHTGTYETKHFTIRYRPGSRAGASVERTGAAAERDLDRIFTALALKPQGHYDLWLYDDLRELHLLTGSDGNAGFSSGTPADAPYRSHIPYDADQTRFHEMVHIVAADRVAFKTPNMFFNEGLANALLEHVDGVHVHAIAKWYRAHGKLPAIAEMTGAADFYAFLSAHPGLDTYDIAASWFRFLIDTHGIEKVKKYYGGAAPKAAFGQDEAALEKTWFAALDAYVMRPEVETLLCQRHGEDADFTHVVPQDLPAELLGKPEDWISLLDAKLRPVAAADWKRTKDGISATWTAGTPGDWSVCELGDELLGDCVVRAKVKSSGAGGLQLRLGPENQLMLVNGTFVYRDGSPVAHAPFPSMAVAKKDVDLALIRRGSELTVYVNGTKVLTLDAAGSPTRPGIAIVGGAATFTDVRYRKLPAAKPR
jgi:hypothetical protein